MLLRLYRESLRAPRSSGHLFEAEEDMITRDAKNGQRGQSFFQAAEQAKEAWMLASPCFKIGRRHSNSNPSAGVEPKIRSKRSANLAKGRIVDHERHSIDRYVGVPLAAPQRSPPSPQNEVGQY